MTTHTHNEQPDAVDHIPAANQTRVPEGSAAEVSPPAQGADAASIPATPPEPTSRRFAALDIFDQHATFESLGLRNSVLKGVEEAGFQKPTSVQAQLIPVILTGKDVLGQAKTGSGKTAAFGLPLLHACNKDLPFQALVLAPTRELAIQITTEINDLGKHTPIRATTVYGGDSIRGQAEKLRTGSHIVVGTPGRLMDMVERGIINYNNVKFVVLDEVDRMLDIGFRDDIRRILEACPARTQRQTIVVSATISNEIERLARKYMNEPEKIIVAAGSLTVSRVKQFHLPVNGWDKKRLLLHLLRHEEPALTIVFCRLKRTVDEIAVGLTKRGIDAHPIHGDMPQGKRNRVMQKLREGGLSVLVASDLAARGIDVDDISHVINFDLPEDPEVYVHRIGRTARAGREGIAWSFVTPDQGELLTEIEMLINTEIPKLDYPGFAPGPRPEGYRDPAPGGRPQGGLTLANPVAAKERAPQSQNRYALELPVHGSGMAGLPVTTPNVPDASPHALEAHAGAAPAAAAASMPMGHEGATAPITPPAAAKPAPTVVVDPSKFPMGLVPTKLPPKRLMGKVRSRGGR
jgi:ATP-dependent RNA helicase DeaD